MHTQKSVKVDKVNLKEGDVVWSEHYKAYIQYVGLDYSDDYVFKYLHNDKYCIIYTSDLYEIEPLLKELL